ncbi:MULTISPECIES: CidA/LrgA family protein [Alphaproteobacteria]|uniref:Murein hydrolase exporter n=2 Tax=Alphaproteobacteria TaxID=28211 RepID=A0A512HPS8_9HYPH|nr:MULTISPECIES: CidA/LrgA family protein [Alphaproteobacteria]GEO87457.1 murein hydrolase exporter [Ciceribacter naphthalenivorans]GLR23415.1 murein hydrolase exporter [Ciceribacter naphthalenivorans]GLT06271.1 murein hydrolase exporter [Sphingomonas psychrolutea]
MSTHRAAVILRRHLHSSRFAQIAALTLFWIAGEGVVRALALPIPGGVAGMLIVLALLGSGKLHPLSMRRGSQWFLAEMLLFFVPAVLAVLDHQELLGLLGLKVLGVILAGTIIVMGATALAVDFGYRLMLRLEGGSHAHG